MADKKISQLTPTTTVDLADQYAIARGSGNFHVSYNTLKTDLSVNTSSFVQTVNAVAPDSTGNVTVSLTAVETGTSASMRAYSSSGLFTEGDVWVISGESGSASGSNGDSYIYSGENTLLRLSGLDTAGNDARYVNVSGDTLTGDLILNGDPTTANQAANKAYVDANTTVGTNGQTIRFNGTTPTANSLIFNNGTEVGIGTTSPTAGIPLSVDSGASNISMELQGRVANPPSLQFNVTDAAYGGVLWMSGADGHFNFGARSGFPDVSRRVSAADPVDSHNLATKNYVDTNFVELSGDTMSGNLQIAKDDPKLILNDTVGNAISIVEFQDNGTRTGYVGDFSGGTNQDIGLAAQNTNGSIVLAPSGTGVIRVETVNTSNAVRITNVATPTAAQDAATKNYVDGLLTSTIAAAVWSTSATTSTISNATKITFNEASTRQTITNDTSQASWNTTNNEFALTEGTWHVVFDYRKDTQTNTNTRFFQLRYKTTAGTGTTGTLIDAAPSIVNTTSGDEKIHMEAILTVPASTTYYVFFWIASGGSVDGRFQKAICRRIG